MGVDVTVAEMVAVEVGVAVGAEAQEVDARRYLRTAGAGAGNLSIGLEAQRFGQSLIDHRHSSA